MPHSNPLEDMPRFTDRRGRLLLIKSNLHVLVYSQSISQDVRIRSGITINKSDINLSENRYSLLRCMPDLFLDLRKLNVDQKLE